LIHKCAKRRAPNPRQIYTSSKFQRTLIMAAAIMISKLSSYARRARRARPNPNHMKGSNRIADAPTKCSNKRQMPKSTTMDADRADRATRIRAKSKLSRNRYGPCMYVRSWLCVIYMYFVIPFRHSAKVLQKSHYYYHFSFVLSVSKLHAPNTSRPKTYNDCEPRPLNP
jgi:hypothetical protein